MLACAGLGVRLKHVPNRRGKLNLACRWRGYSCVVELPCVTQTRTGHLAGMAHHLKSLEPSKTAKLSGYIYIFTVDVLRVTFTFSSNTSLDSVHKLCGCGVFYGER